MSSRCDLHHVPARSGPGQGRISTGNERNELRGHARLGILLRQSISVLLARSGEGSEWRGSRYGSELGNDGHEHPGMGQ